MNDIAVFLGPSLPVAQAERILPAGYHPPAAAGDVYRAATRGARAIVLIDGYFSQVPSVWHKEVLFALSRGIAVYGGASMGALRAAELAPFGMIGVGSVFEAFREGTYEDDDEVAVAHAAAEHAFRPLSEAMVNLRHGLALAEARAVIGPAARRSLERGAKQRFYPDRSWPALFAEAEALGVPAEEREALRRFVRTERPDLKRDDAVATLRRAGEDLARDLPPADPTFVFQPTSMWRELVQSLEADDDGAEEEVSADAELRAEALLLHLVAQEAARLGVTVGAEEVAAARRDLPPGDDGDELAVLRALIEPVAARRGRAVSAYLRLARLRRGAE